MCGDLDSTEYAVGLEAEWGHHRAGHLKTPHVQRL